jgi:hypothetical protein
MSSLSWHVSMSDGCLLKLEDDGGNDDAVPLSNSDLAGPSDRARIHSFAWRLIALSRACCHSINIIIKTQ